MAQMRPWWWVPKRGHARAKAVDLDGVQPGQESRACRMPTWQTGKRHRPLLLLARRAFEALTAAYKNAMSSSSSTGWMHRLAPLWTQVGASLLEFWRPLIDRRILIPKNLLAFGSWIFALHRPDAHNLPSSSTSRTVVYARKHQSMQELGDEGQQVLDSEFSLAYHRREMF